MDPARDLIDDGMCFVCGPRNQNGLRLEFEPRADEVVAEFVPAVHHQGYRGIVHGGIISTLLDEAMAHVMVRRGRPALTAKIEVKFLQAASIGEKLVIRARLRHERSRTAELEASATTQQGAQVATARGTWIRVEPPPATTSPAAPA